MKKSVTSLAIAAALCFSAGLHAQAPASGTVTELVKPALGRQALPLGAVIKGGTDMGKTITGAVVTLPGQQVLVDVVITQVSRDASGRVIGGTVSDKLAFLVPTAPSTVTASKPAPAAAPVSTAPVTPATSSTASSAPAAPVTPPPSSVAQGAGMTGAVSPGLLAAIAIGAALAVGGGGSSTPSHGAQ